MGTAFDGMFCFGAGCAKASGANGLTIDALTLEAQLHAAQAEDEGWLSAVRCLLWAQIKATAAAVLPRELVPCAALLSR